MGDNFFNQTFPEIFYLIFCRFRKKPAFYLAGLLFVVFRYSPLSILPLTLKTPLSVTNNTSHSTPSTIDDYLEDYRIFITIFLTAWRSGQLTGITQLSKLLECPEFKRMDQRFLYSDHGATLTGLDGLSFNGFTNQWIFRPPP